MLVWPFWQAGATLGAGGAPGILWVGSVQLLLAVGAFFRKPSVWQVGCYHVPDDVERTHVPMNHELTDIAPVLAEPDKRED